VPFDSKGEFEVDDARFRRGLPFMGDCDWLLKLLLRGVER
jgi:hypothetical protein